MAKQTYTNEEVAKSIADAKEEYERQQRKHWRYTFAGMALQGFLASGKRELMSAQEWAGECLMFADALLAELERKEQEKK